MKTEVNTIIVPDLFHKLPKVLQDIVYEYNCEHRFQMKCVLKQLITHIFCQNCSGLISPSLLNRVYCCSAECMYELMDGWMD
jgi:hypothetical protein